MRRRLLVVAGVLLVACKGPTYPESPILPDPPPLVAKALHIVVSPAELAIGGGDAELLLEATTGPFGAGVKDLKIALAVTGGTLERTEAVTDSTGHAKVRWSGTQTAIVSATSGDLATQTTIRVREPQTFPPPPSPPSPRPNPPAPLPPLPPAPGPIETPDSNLVLTITTNPTDVVVNQPVRLNAALSTLDGSTAPTIAYVVWDFDASRPGPDVTALAPSHTFTSTGPQSLQATAVTTGSRSTTADVTVNVLATTPPPPPPDPAVSVTLNAAPQSVSLAAGGTISFTATPTLVGAAGSVLSYGWDFDGNGTLDMTTGIGTVDHTYSTAGTPTVRVTVTTTTGLTATATTLVAVVQP